MSECDVVVVGAGVAGLAAAAALRRAGLDCVVIEAADRIGGRAWTTPLGDAPFDHGASWLHAAGRNKLADIARTHGDRLIDSDAIRSEMTIRDGAPIGPADEAAYEAAQAMFERLAQASLAGPDISLAAAVAPAAAMPWMASIVNWEAPVIAAADAVVLSLRDWHTNRLEGSNLQVEGGLGRFVARRLGAAAGPVRLGIAADAIAWDGRRVVVHTSGGAIRAGACIVTVSTGVLASGAIGFTPALPVAVQAAIAGLPMGVLNKVALRASGGDRLGLPDSCGIDQFVARIGDPAMAFIAWPYGHDHVIGFLGGSMAAALEAGGAEAFARAQLRDLFGVRADAAFAPGAVVTRWAANPLTRGAYAYAMPGHADARGVLAEPLAGGRLVFAGEATCTDGLAGTVGGAWLSGQRAAGVVTACVAG
jgi:monoamine oxidase